MKFKSAVKLVLSAVMLYLVLRLTNFEKLKTTAESLSISAVAIVVMLYAIGQVLSACKWWIIAKNAGINVSFTSAIKAYFIGMFVNCFGFGTVGGDLTRALLISSGQESKITGLSTVIADRAHGLAVLATIGAISAIMFGSKILAPEYIWIMVFLAVGIILFWIVGAPLASKFLTPENKFRILTDQIFAAFPRKKRVILSITGISLTFHFLQISLHYVMGYYLFVDLPMKELFVIIPIINILATLPISWNGLGVREQSYKAFLAPQLISVEQALAFGALWLLSVTVCSAVGGLIAVLSEDFKQLKISSKIN